MVVSEPFANKHNVQAGDTLTLQLGGKSAEFLYSTSTTTTRASAATSSWIAARCFAICPILLLRTSLSI